MLTRFYFLRISIWNFRIDCLNSFSKSIEFRCIDKVNEFACAYFLSIAIESNELAHKNVLIKFFSDCSKFEITLSQGENKNFWQHKQKIITQPISNVKCWIAFEYYLLRSRTRLAPDCDTTLAPDHHINLSFYIFIMLGLSI